MRARRVLYRIRQFWQAAAAAPAAADLTLAAKVLSAAQMGLFRLLQPAEQAHSLEVLRRLQQAGETHPDLLVAALLHDLGKSKHPLAPWERALIVLALAVLPEKVRQWGAGEARGWRKLFAVAVQHAAWGAEMAQAVGTSPLAVSLIRRHQEYFPGATGVAGTTLEDELLKKLQYFDDES